MKRDVTYIGDFLARVAAALDHRDERLEAARREAERGSKGSTTTSDRRPARGRRLAVGPC